jgi:hypothetical protein
MIVCSENAGVTVHDEDDDVEGEYCQPITRAANVRPDTPVPGQVPTAPESEPEESEPELEPLPDRVVQLDKGKSREIELDME